MDKRGTIQKIMAEACRLLLGVVFTFSGSVKAVDPVGGAIKIKDYLTAFGWDALQPLALMLSFGLSALEFALGICLLLGVYRRYSTLLALLMMAFMTPLTLYLAIFNPVSDCGCFGDALVITNWQTFYKNVVLSAAAIYAFMRNHLLWPCYTPRTYWIVAAWAYLFAIGFAYRNYDHLPVLDFRPYKIGANIPALMAIPEGAPEDEYLYSFIYEKDGVRKEFSLEDAPAGDSTWTFVDSNTRLIRKGYEPPITDFHLYDTEGNELTDEVLADPRGLFLLIASHVEEADDDRIDEINNVYDYAAENGLGFYGVTGSSAEAIAEWYADSGAEYPFLTADETLLKTIIRSNPGLVLMREGTILMKWNANDIPQEEDLQMEINAYLEGNTDRKAKEDALLRTNLLSFAVPLLLVWGHDTVRYRRRRKEDAPE